MKSSGTSVKAGFVMLAPVARAKFSSLSFYGCHIFQMTISLILNSFPPLSPASGWPASSFSSRYHSFFFFHFSLIFCLPAFLSTIIRYLCNNVILSILKKSASFIFSCSFILKSNFCPKAPSRKPTRKTPNLRDLLICKKP